MLRVIVILGLSYIGFGAPPPLCNLPFFFYLSAPLFNARTNSGEGSNSLGVSIVPNIAIGDILLLGLVFCLTWLHNVRGQVCRH